MEYADPDNVHILLEAPGGQSGKAFTARVPQSFGSLVVGSVDGLSR